MRRSELKLALQAAGRVAGDAEFYVIGSQALHASVACPPTEVVLSQECDLYPRNLPQTALRLAAELGRGSRFARQHGFYVDVVAPELSTLPSGWERRLQPLRAGPVTAYCLETHDLIISKLAAGRLKDLEFIGALFCLRLARPRTARARLARFDDPALRARLGSRLQMVLETAV